MVRLDHFRGFEAYYAVDYGSDDATTGEWVPGPGRALFERFVREFGHRPLVAEDLGEIDEAVHTLRRNSGLLCTRVLQFGLDDPTGHSLHLPERCCRCACLHRDT